MAMFGWLLKSSTTWVLNIPGWNIGICFHWKRPAIPNAFFCQDLHFRALTSINPLTEPAPKVLCGAQRLLPAMPITLRIAPREAEGIHPSIIRNNDTAQDILQRVRKSKESSCREMLQSSLKSPFNFVANRNGFVNAVVRAYNQHHNLILRPDDIWAAILAQLNLYVNAHAKELRSSFVAHEGNKTLKIVTAGNRYSVEFGALARQLGDLLRENIVDPSLHEWILSKFSTTTDNDVIVYSIMMMATLKAYFSYEIHLRCGIPSITLLGHKADYETILSKLNKLDEFGAEPAAFARLLRPVLSQFVSAFDSKEPDYDFWSKICHYKSGGSGPSYLSGWISAFCVWNREGKWQGPDLNDIERDLLEQEIGIDKGSWNSPPLPLLYAGLRYPVINTNKIPTGFCEVDVMLDDNGEIFDCAMVAGHVGAVASRQGEDLNTLQPAVEWFMFVKEDPPR